MSSYSTQVSVTAYPEGPARFRVRDAGKGEPHDVQCVIDLGGVNVNFYGDDGLANLDALRLVLDQAADEMRAMLLDGLIPEFNV